MNRTIYLATLLFFGLIVALAVTVIWKNNEHWAEQHFSAVKKDLAKVDSSPLNQVRSRAAAQRFRQTVLTTPALSFREEVFHKPGRQHVTLESKMGTNGRVSDLLLVDSRPVWKFLATGREIYEMCFDKAGQPYLVKAYSGVRDYNGWEKQLEELGQKSAFPEFNKLGCLIGGELESWVSPVSSQLGFFETEIGLSRFLGETRYAGETCEIFASPTQIGYHLFYIGKETGLLRIFATTQDTHWYRPTAIRVREYHEIKLGPLPDSTWELSPAERMVFKN